MTPAPNTPRRQGFYASLYTEEEQQALESPASLDDELALLRSRVRRLASRLDGELDPAAELRGLSVLLHMVQVIAALERAKAADRGRETAPGVLEALASIDPYEQL